MRGRTSTWMFWTSVGGSRAAWSTIAVTPHAGALLMAADGWQIVTRTLPGFTVAS